MDSWRELSIECDECDRTNAAFQFSVVDARLLRRKCCARCFAGHDFVVTVIGICMYSVVTGRRAQNGEYMLVWRQSCSTALAFGSTQRPSKGQEIITGFNPALKGLEPAAAVAGCLQLDQRED